MENKAQVIEVNAYWIVCITSEMLLNLKTGLKNRGGSPFTQFRRVFTDCPADKNKAMLFVGKLADDYNTENAKLIEADPTKEMRLTKSVKAYIETLRAQQPAPKA